MDRERHGVPALLARQERSPRHPQRGRRDGSFGSSYEEYFGTIDPYFDAVASSAPRSIGCVTIDEMHVTARDLSRTEFYNDYWRYHISHGMGVVLGWEHGWNNFNLMRAPGRRAYEPERVEALQALAPHLMRAVEIDRRLETAAASLSEHRDLLDQLRAGVALLDARGRLIHLNTALEGLLSRGDGLSRRHESLVCEDSKQNSALQRLITRATETALGRALHTGGSVRIDRSRSSQPLVAFVAPFRPIESKMAAHNAVCAVFVDDPDSGSGIDPTRLESVFDLTPAEARIAALLSRGLPVNEIARRRRVKADSVRTQLKTIYAKTATSNQAEVVSLILRSGLNRSANDAESS